MNKKTFLTVPAVGAFIDSLIPVDKAEVFRIINTLQAEGCLSAPFGEKVEAGLFAMRVIKAGNLRIFYIYGNGSAVYGVHAYFKRTESIPPHELRQARRAASILKREGHA